MRKRLEPTAQLRPPATSPRRATRPTASARGWSERTVKGTSPVTDDGIRFTTPGAGGSAVQLIKKAICSPKLHHHEWLSLVVCADPGPEGPIAVAFHHENTVAGIVPRGRCLLFLCHCGLLHRPPYCGRSGSWRHPGQRASWVTTGALALAHERQRALDVEEGNGTARERPESGRPWRGKQRDTYGPTGAG